MKQLHTIADVYGTLPDNPENRNKTKYSNNFQYFSEYNQQFEQGEKYENDKSKMEELDISNIGRKYWYAERFIQAYASSTTFYVRYVNSNGKYSEKSQICHVNSTTGLNSLSPLNGLRVVFTLKPSISIITDENGNRVIIN